MNGHPRTNVLDYGERGQVVVLDSAEVLAEVAADLVAKTSIKAADEDRMAYIALSGGSTPKAMGKILAGPKGAEVKWDHITFFWGDERWVPLDDPESNAGEAKRAFIDASPIPESQVMPFKTAGIDPFGAASDMERRIHEIVPGEPIPRFDLILLGMGDDGHTASLFPGSDAINEHESLVVAHRVEKLDALRLTFTPALINAAKHVAFLVSGSGKAATLSDVLDGGIDVDRLPSQVVRPTDGTLTWLVDAAAAADLERAGADE
jgi:6-phosphogluconolactonase